MLRARLFGGLALAWDQDPVPMIPGRAARSLFAYLVTYRDRPHTRDLLAGTFWPDLSDAIARRRLSRALWQIRRVLRPFVLPQDRQAQDQASLPSPVLVAEGDTIQLNPDLSLWLDVEEFTRHNAQCTRAGPDAIVHCELCIEHYQGEFLAGYYDDWVVVERERLRDMFLETLARLVEGYKGQGEYERALLYARRLAAEDPWREEAHREVMRLCHLLGQDAEALKQFEVCRQVLAEELGAEPSPETTALANEIATRSGLSEPPVLPSTARPVTTPLLERPDRLPLIGRQSELAELLRQVEAALEGSGGLTVVYGEAGVGKSRLLREVAHNAQWRGLHAVWGRCYELAAPHAYQPLVEALRAGLPVLSDAALGPLWRAELSRLLPELTTDAGLPPPLSSEEEKRRLLEAIARAFVSLAEAAPHLVLLEDAHWMDPASLEALRYLLPRLTEARLLFVITVRPEELAGQELAHQPAAALSAMEDTHLSRRLELGRLDLAETEELVQRALDLEQPAPRFSARLYAETEGNAFFLIETLWALVEEGLLYRDEAGAWSTPWDESTEDYAELPLSAGVAQSIERRLERLPDRLNQVLDLAAVIGREVSFGLWLSASGRDEEALLTTGDELCARGLLLTADPDYIFAHDQIRRVAYERLAPPRRRFYHRRVAQALTRLTPDEVVALAHHWTQAEVWHKAVAYHQQAGDRARGVYASREAVGHYTQALACLELLSEPVDRARSYDLHLAREAVYDLLGERAAQAEDLKAMMTLAEALEDDRRWAEVDLRQAHYAEVTGNYPAAIAAIAQAIHRAATAQDADLEAAGYQQWGQVLWRQGDYQAARLQLEQALTLGRAAGLRQAEADSLRNLGIVCWYLGDLMAAQEYFEQSYSICREIGNRQGEGTGLNNLGLVAVSQGNYAQAKVCFEQAVNIYRQLGDRFNESVTLGNLGGVAAELGDYDGARAYHEQALYLCRMIGNRQTEAHQLACLSLLCHRLEDHEAAKDYGQQVLRIAAEIGDRGAQAYGLTYMGHALASLELLTEAERAYQQALHIRRELGQATMAIELVAGLARVALARGDLAQAHAHVKEILEYLETGSLEGADEPLRVYLTCYRVLWAQQHPRAEGILSTAHGLLQEQAAKIADEVLRRSFLENVAVHREIVAAYQELHASPEHRPGAERITVSLPRADAPLGRPLRDDEYVTVTWTVAAPEDEAIAGKVARRHQRILRLLSEAQAQGAAPTHSHLAEALGVSRRTIERDMVLLRRQEQVTIPPTRGKMSE